ncbi:MAG: diacylglycerol kinase family lipid kinase [Firmicutes bacterium]|jgi:YegS/Rv2252/BmrU family lipid kinase|nr:diacylglycerol kinase family lipid kinase [Bacillota bacterium]MCL5066651.1 diacylglycerol kinase family lipid kinase [Bacillota bacterium]
MRTCLIYNPTAGNGKATAVYNALRPRLQALEVEVFTTEGPRHATELARQFAHDSECTVISLGGDGTHHEIINGLMPEGKAIFAVIPAGTGNDFVRVLGYPKEPLAMLEVATTGTPTAIDLGQAGDEYFLTVSGVGFDAEVAGWVNQRSKAGSGRGVFLRAILYHLFFYRSRPITVSIDGHPPETVNSFVLAAGNTPYYASGMQICPNANLHDGTLSLVWIESLSRLEVLPMLLHVIQGKHLGSRRVRTFEAKTVTVAGPSELWVHADGEILGHLPITLQALPQAIRVRMGSV